MRAAGARNNPINLIENGTRANPVEIDQICTKTFFSLSLYEH